MELPYDTDPNYMTMMSRTELQNPSSRQKQQQTQQTVTTNIGEEMSEIFKSLQKMDDSKKNVTLSPRAEQSILNNEIQMLVRLQKKLQVLHFKNMHEEISIPSLPVRGQRVSVEERKKKP
ncbi:uncharacterized protein [Periplaneta americana]|uniref:uncharacterized protein n=1 Tax=Periplaneta americana TaxID=6978 RepID=UPI0037E7C6F7